MGSGLGVIEYEPVETQVRVSRVLRLNRKPS